MLREVRHRSHAPHRVERRAAQMKSRLADESSVAEENPTAGRGSFVFYTPAEALARRDAHLSELA